MVDSIRRDRVDALPGPWRRVEVVVTPERVDAIYGGSRFASLDKEGLRIRTATLRQWVDENVAGTPVTEWSTRRPFGVWVYGSWVAVKNFTVTPLTEPKSP